MALCAESELALLYYPVHPGVSADSHRSPCVHLNLTEFNHFQLSAGIQSVLPVCLCVPAPHYGACCLRCFASCSQMQTRSQCSTVSLHSPLMFLRKRLFAVSRLLVGFPSL